MKITLPASSPLLLLLPLLLPTFSTAQTDSLPRPVALLRPFDRATVWEGVRIKTAQVFEEETVEPGFKIKKKEKRRELVAALEGQFQVNVADGEIRSLKRAGALADYIFEAQQGVALFSKAGFQGKVERFADDREHCKENGDCINFIGALIVPKGYRLTLYNQPGFKGEQLVIDAAKGEIRIPSLLAVTSGEGITNTGPAVNWRESVQSLKVEKS
jgi:hypothetical protein